MPIHMSGSDGKLEPDQEDRGVGVYVWRTYHHGLCDFRGAAARPAASERV